MLTQLLKKINDKMKDDIQSLRNNNLGMYEGMYDNMNENNKKKAIEEEIESNSKDIINIAERDATEVHTIIIPKIKDMFDKLYRTYDRHTILTGPNPKNIKVIPELNLELHRTHKIKLKKPKKSRKLTMANLFNPSDMKLQKLKYAHSRVGKPPMKIRIKKRKTVSNK